MGTPGKPSVRATAAERVTIWPNKDGLGEAVSVVPVVPEFDDSDNRLQWKFQGSKAQGTANNEIVVALG